MECAIDQLTKRPKKEGATISRTARSFLVLELDARAMSPNYEGLLHMILTDKSTSEKNIDIDVLHTELAAAYAHRNQKQADFDKLETLKKRKKGGWSMSAYYTGWLRTLSLTEWIRKMECCIKGISSCQRCCG